MCPWGCPQMVSGEKLGCFNQWIFHSTQKFLVSSLQHIQQGQRSLGARS